MSTVLGKDEEMIREDVFTANLILFWLKSNYTMTNKRITGHMPNTIMGLIPLGKAQMAIPLKNISSIISSTEFFFKRLLLGLILVIIGFAMLGSSFILAIILLLLGAVNILNSYTATFIITNNAGQEDGYEISILEKGKVEEFVNQINTKIAEL